MRRLQWRARSWPRIRKLGFRHRYRGSALIVPRLRHLRESHSRQTADLCGAQFLHASTGDGSLDQREIVARARSSYSAPPRRQWVSGWGSWREPRRRHVRRCRSRDAKSRRRPCNRIQGCAQRRCRTAVVIASERRADGSEVCAELKRDRNCHGCVAGNRFDWRAGLVRRQENLGNPAIGIASGAKREIEPGMAEFERFA
jgi:hypothetical protein